MLDIRGLTLCYPGPSGDAIPVREFELSICAGEIVGLCGRSGCGKTALCSALMGMIEHPGYVRSGTVTFAARSGTQLDLLSLDERQWRCLRGNELAMITQNPSQTLNPSRTVGRQFREVIRAHSGANHAECTQLTLDMLRRVWFDDPERMMALYPFELSGGMAQRVVIAMTLSHRPTLLIADEPTTALDVKIQAQIVRLLVEVREAFGTAVLFISHDERLVGTVADRVVRM